MLSAGRIAALHPLVLPDALELPVSLAGGVKAATVPTLSTEYLVKHWEL